MLNFKKHQEKVQEPAQPPFWDDELDLDIYGRHPLPTLIKITGILAISLILLYPLAFTIYLLWKFIGPIAVFAYIAFMLLSLANGFILRKRNLALAEKQKQIQMLARQTTGAEVIDSAVHVAGHPLFERDQPVVLALKGDELSIYTYQSQIPVDVIHTGDIQAIHTVVYDDERIPHIDVIDSTAQAMQITFISKGIEYTCLFRRLRKVHAIDWFHTLQKAKHTE